MKKDITVILPVNEVTSNFEPYFNRAIQSLEIQVRPVNELIIVYSSTKEVKEWLTDWESGKEMGEDKFTRPEGLTITLVENKEKTDFCSQINLGVKNCKTPWFSILEFDDEYSRNWFKNFDVYTKEYNEVEIFLPLVVDVNVDNTFLGFTNESLWAMKFSEKLGFLDNNTLLNYQNFQISGAIYKKESFEDIGGFKSNLKLTFGYEFLLRATYNDLQIMTIPKIGYKHANMREFSLFWNYKNNPQDKLAADEGQFWVDAAKKEYFFTYDREISYEGN